MSEDPNRTEDTITGAPRITIKRYYLDNVLQNDKVLFNVNNLYVTQPADYRERLNQGNTRHWIDKFHAEGTYRKITLDAHDLKWMTKAQHIGMQTRQFSHIFDDELDAICAKYGNRVPPGNWFVRTESVSLKEGMHGVGPYTDFRSIIQSMVSSGLGHLCFEPNAEECNIYLLPWIDINPDLEFRVFVYQNKITAISSQHLYSINTTLNNMTDNEIIALVYRIIAYFDTVVKDRLSYLVSYTMDFAFTRENKPYFIEPNSFGRNYAAGSSLFHWIYDHDILHGDSDDTDIEVRYVNEY